MNGTDRTLISIRGEGEDGKLRSGLFFFSTIDKMQFFFFSGEKTRFFHDPVVGRKKCFRPTSKKNIKKECPRSQFAILSLASDCNLHAIWAILYYCDLGLKYTISNQRPESKAFFLATVAKRNYAALVHNERMNSALPRKIIYVRFWPFLLFWAGAVNILFLIGLLILNKVKYLF